MSSKSESSEPCCGICGEQHLYCDCTSLSIKNHVPDKLFPPKARSSLPDIVCIETMADGSFAIVANALIEKGTQFGPLEAQKLLTLDPGIIFPLKLFNSSEDDFSEYYLNTMDEYHCNWIMFITPAHNIEEQNLICFQHKSKIMYVCLKDISAGEYLKVWYSPYYAKRMKKELLTSKDISIDFPKDNCVLDPIDLNRLMRKQQKLTDRDNWICKFCGKLEKDVILFAKHIIEHYNEKVTYDCKECDKTFTKKKILQTHVRKVHKKPIVIDTNQSVTIDNAQSKDVVMGGPSLNDLLTDSLDNTSLVLPNIEINLNNLESEALNLAVDNLLTENVKELDHFNFEISESQEQYICDICLKVFGKLRCLLQHLKKHTGRFTCGYCLKIFCRKENLNSHKCKHNRKYYTHQCTICGKQFLLNRYLLRHMCTVHEKRYACEKCDKINNTWKEYNEHNCAALPEHEKEVFPCATCGRRFFHIRYLKKHMDRHLPKKDVSVSQNFICEICGLKCTSPGGLSLHRKKHSGNKFECPICNKKFHRADSLKEHTLVHSDAKVTCNICNKDFKSKQHLKKHALHHTNVKQYKCDKCPRTFSQAGNLNTHVSKVHSKLCTLCNKQFNTLQLLEMHKKTHHVKEFYICPLCSKCMKLKGSLCRHIKRYHPDNDVTSLLSNLKLSTASFVTSLEQEIEDVKEKSSPTILDQLGTNSALSHLTGLQDSISDNDSNFDSIVDNFENIINSYNMSNNDNLPVSLYNDPKPNEKRMLDFTDLQMDIDSNFDVNAMGINNVCLSMPDLTETDQEIMLGDSAFILDNGTIVEPKDQGNVLVYVLDKNM